MTDWIEVKTYSNQFEAEVAKSILESVGIKYQVYVDNVGTLGNYYPILNRISIYVPKEDLTKAQEILNNKNPKI